MKRWPVVNLGDVADMCLGKMLDAKKNKGRPLPYLRNPNVRWLDIDLSDVQEMRFEERESERYGLRDGDVLVCEGGEAGRAAIWNGQVAEMKFQKALHRIRCRPSLYNRFLVHQLMADHSAGRLADYYTGVTIKHLTGQDLARYRIALPPVEEQRRIAEILDKADALRAQRRAAIAQLHTLAQSIFLDMFGDPATNPKGWQKKSFADVCEIRLGKMLDKKRQTGSGRRLYIRNANVQWFRFDLSDLLEMDFDEQERAVLRLQAGDLLICEGGEPGRSAVWRGEVAECYFQKALHRARARRDLATPEYLNWLLWFLAERRLLVGITSATIAHLTGEKLARLPVLLPPLEVQLEFGNRIASVDYLNRIHTRGLEHLEGLFLSIQQHAFAGRL